MIKKIITKEEKAKKNQRNQLAIGLILIILMLLSTVGYALNSQDNSSGSSSSVITYNGIEFIRNGDYYIFEVDSKQFMTKYSPNDTKDIVITNKVRINDYKDKPVYIATESGLPNIELITNLQAKGPLRLSNACLKEQNCTKDYPIKDCSSDSIIVIKEPNKDEKEGIYQDINCVYIRTNTANETKLVDAYIFNILGIQ